MASNHFWQMVIYSHYRYSRMGTTIHSTKCDRAMSTLLASPETEKLPPESALKELLRKAPLTSLLRKLLKINLCNIFLFLQHSSGDIRRTVNPKEKGFNFRLVIHIRGICTDIEMAIICGTMVWRLKFLKIVSDACDVHLCKAPDCWPTCASASFLLSQVKTLTDHNPANCWLEGVLRPLVDRC